MYLRFFNWTQSQTDTTCQIWIRFIGDFDVDARYFYTYKIPVSFMLSKLKILKNINLKFRLSSRTGIVLFLIYLLFLGYAFTQELACNR